MTLSDFIEDVCRFFRTKDEVAQDNRFLRAENADLRALVVKAQQSEADAIALMAQAEMRAERFGCNDVVHMQLASENARLRTALGEPMEAKK